MWPLGGSGWPPAGQGWPPAGQGYWPVLSKARKDFLCYLRQGLLIYLHWHTVSACTHTGILYLNKHSLTILIISTKLY